jgi:hypothetical protein
MAPSKESNMATRITKQDIDARVTFINNTYGGSDTVSLGGAYGGYRVENGDGSESLSRYGSKRETYEYLRAMITALDGIRTGRFVVRD